MNANYLVLPEHMREPMRRYIEERIRPGSFLGAVLSNDLNGAYATADHINVDAVKHFIMFLSNYAPRACWGSAAKFEAWLLDSPL